MIKFYLFVLFNILFIQYSYAQVYPVWLQRYDSYNSAIDMSSDMALDSLGNIYITSWSAGVNVVKYNNNGQIVWQNLQVNDQYIHPLGIKVCKSSNVYISAYYDWVNYWVLIKYNNVGDTLWRRDNTEGYADGNYRPTIILDDDENCFVIGDIYPRKIGIVKYDSGGNLKFAKEFNFTIGASALSAVRDSYKNFFIAGAYYPSNFFASKTLLLKLDSSGNQVWSKIYDSSYFVSSCAKKIVLDKENNIALGISVTDSGTTREHFSTVKYSNNGNFLWSKFFKIPVYDDEILTLKVDSKSNIIVGALSGIQGTSPDYCTVKYDSSGNRKWLRFYTSYPSPYLNEDRISSMCLDDSDNIYITGSSATIKYDYNGNLKWVFDNIINGIFFFSNRILLDKSNNVYLYGDANFLNTWNHDLFTAKLSQAGGQLSQINASEDFHLYQNYPNPFNSSTEIKYHIKNNNSAVMLIVYDILGKEITTLVKDKFNAGDYSVKFNENSLSSGIYFYRLIVNNKAGDTKKMFLIK
jgi:hypothetical protein